jgi:hemoglobin-like flavoprotein
MGVSAEDRRVLHECLPLVLERMRPMSERFYDNLFVLEPEVQELFAAHLGGRGMRFVGTLATVVALVEDEAALDRSAAALGRAHAGYGVKPEHYPALGHALLVTLGETLGREFTARRQAAWRAAYDALAERMIAAGDHES